jgi:Spy/CpxP family protein refolding chaperone
MTTIRHSICMICCFVTVMFLMASPIHGQTATPQSTTDNRTTNLKALLSLTDAQTTQVRDILTRSDAKTAQKTNKKASKKALHLREAAIDKEVEALLTPDQLKKYDSYKKARRDHSKGWRKGKGSEYNF